MRVTVIVIIVLMSLLARAQKYDYRWILGTSYSGNTDIVFTDSTADTVNKNHRVYMGDSQTVISDSSGNLLFYTNGACVYNRIDSTMQNGDSLNFGTEWTNFSGGDYPCLDEMIAVPSSKPGIWNLFHYFLVYNPFGSPNYYVWRVYQSEVDMNADSGLGAVVFKNKTLVQDTLGSYVAACQHANGRDWWILASQSSSNCLYELLSQPDTVIEYPMQCLGSDYISQDGGQAAFSPDGTKFAWTGEYGGINIYDFDRCSGTLSKHINMPFYPNFVDSGFFQAGIAFSPNSKLLYVTQGTYIFQFDLSAGDIAASVDTVGHYTPPPDSTSAAGYFFLMQLAPDGKIYISADNGIKWLHVISQPDLRGDSCNEVNYGFPLPNYNTFGLPSYPGNYRLGAWQGSPCDTISGLTEVQRTAKEKILKIYPNPAADYTIVDYGFTDWSKGEVQLQICNALGQTVYAQQLPMYSGFQRIDISSWAGGMYSVYIKRNNGVVASGKLVKE